jgi:hypothetical protein
MSGVFLFAAFLVALFLAVRFATVQLRKQRTIEYMRENNEIWEAHRMDRFRRWIRSMEYTGPDEIQPRWRYRPDPHESNGIDFDCY